LTKDASQVKLGDFGICRVLEKLDTEARSVVGTPLFMAPEVHFQRPYTVLVDIWALGIVALFLVISRASLKSAGQFFFYGTCQRQEAIDAMLQFVEDKLSKCGNTVSCSAGYMTLLRSCLQLKPENRLAAVDLLKLDIFRMYSKQRN
jgi:serine/threonine protein kinase